MIGAYKKQFIYLLFFLNAINLYAKDETFFYQRMEAVVIAFETPLFEDKSTSSKIITRLSRGDKIYISRTDLKLDPHDPVARDFETHADKFKDEEFFLTTDRTGNSAYVLQKHLKVIFKDQRENEQVVSLGDSDETDYRPAGPLPKNYPLKDDRVLKKAAFNFGVGTAQKERPPLSENVISEDLSMRLGLNVFLGQDYKKNKSNRVNLGGAFSFFTHKLVYISNTNKKASYTQTEVGAGPYFSYDIYKSERPTLAMVASCLLVKHFLQGRDFNSLETSTEKWLFSPGLHALLKYPIKDDLNILLQSSYVLYLNKVDGYSALLLGLESSF